MSGMDGRTELRVAAVGLGWVSQNRHIPCILRNPRMRLVGTIDKREGRAQEIAEKNKLKLFSQTDSLKEVPWIDEIDAVVIGSAPFSHHALASEALDLGKHVLTEKPFTMTTTDAEDLLRRRDASGKQLCVVHNFQFARSMLAMVKDIESGKLGEIRSLAAVQFGNPKRRLPTWHEDLPLGLFYDESPHLLYLLKRLAPTPLHLEHALVHQSTRGANTPATVSAHYSFASDGKICPAQLSVNFESPLSEWYLIFTGSERLGIVDIFRDIYLSLPNDGAHVASTIIRTSFSATFQHWLQTVTSGFRHFAGKLSYGNDLVFEKFGAAALDGTRPLGIEAEDALTVQRMQHEIIDRAVTVGGQKVPSRPAAID